MRGTIALVALALVAGACANDAPSPSHGSSAPSRGTSAPATRSVPATPSAAPSESPSPSPSTASPAALPAALAFEPVVDGLTSQPLYVTSPADDPRLFIVEQGGLVHIYRDGALEPELFLNVHDLIVAGGERGLLGLAFHPDHATNGRLFVFYTRKADGAIQLVEYTLSDDPDVADAASARVLLEIAHPASQHNGGMLAFGPDGYLYMAVGDGGTGQEPSGAASDPSELLGKILRLDVDGDDPYSTPPDNPFQPPDGAPEVWAMGLRNPWRFAFDPPTERFFVADVGQYRYEEINAIASTTAGAHFGWPVREGRHCYDDEPCEVPGAVDPVLEYTHDEACAVVGGVVYRGAAIPGLRGHYLFTDHCDGRLRSLADADAEPIDWSDGAGTLDLPTSFGTGADGEVYITTKGGSVLKLVQGG